MDRKQLLEKIIAREAAMFIAVKASEPADCCLLYTSDAADE